MRRTFSELQRRKVKRNGCGWPPHPLQVMTYLVVAYQVLVSALCMGPLFEQELAVTFRQVLFCILSGALQSITAILGFLLTLSDPTDPVVYAHRRAIIKK